MSNFWKHVNSVIQESDVVIEVLDARMIDETRNFEIENKIIQFNKKILYVLNKCDLVDIDQLKLDKKELSPCVFISCRDKLGTTILKKKILELSRGEPVVVGVVGYPNVGKCSVINALAGRKATLTSSSSGFTKGLQKVKVDNKIMLLDTPGVFPLREKDALKHAKTSAVSYEKVKDAETVVLRLIEENSGLIKAHYNVGGEDAEEILTNISRKFGKLESGGKPNFDSTARMILKDWQIGKIKM